MNIITEAYKILKWLKWKIRIEHDSSRGKKFPFATWMPSGNVVVIRGGMVALARWGLFEILLHEKTHAILKERGYEHWDEHDEVFMRTYFDLRKKFDNLINREYGV